MKTQKFLIWKIKYEKEECECFDKHVEKKTILNKCNLLFDKVCLHKILINLRYKYTDTIYDKT